MKLTLLILGWIVALSFMAFGLFAMRVGLEWLDDERGNDALRICGGAFIICAAALAMWGLAQ